MKTGNARDKNIAMLQLVAESMGSARGKVVFLGGTVIPFLLTQQVPLEVRKTKDVDFIFGFDSKEELYEFEDTLWERGFTKMRTSSVSQWSIQNVMVDVLPTGPVLGFCNKWCDEAMYNAFQVDIGRGVIVNIIPAPCFLGAKFDKFGKREDDYGNSHDIYDLLLVIAGRPIIEKEILEQASQELRKYLSDELEVLLHKSDDLSALLNRFSRNGQKAGECLPDLLLRIRNIVNQINNRTHFNGHLEGSLNR
jgi:hypothetical protein